jgi:hypothetical protein
MSLAATVFVSWFLLALGRVDEAASFGIGATIGLAMMWTARFAVMRATSPGRFQGKWFAVTLAILKYAVAAYAILWFVRWPHAKLAAFVGGVAITQVVLTMKAVGQMMASGKERGAAGWGRLRLRPDERKDSGEKAVTHDVHTKR